MGSGVFNRSSFQRAGSGGNGSDNPPPSSLHRLLFTPVFVFLFFLIVVCIFLVLAHRIAVEVMMPHISALALSRILCKSLCSVWSFPDSDAHIQIYIYIYIYVQKENLAPFISDFRTKMLIHDGKLLHGNISSAQPCKLWLSQMGKCFFAGYTDLKTKGWIAGDGFDSPFLRGVWKVLPALVAGGMGFLHMQVGVPSKMPIKYNCKMPIERRYTTENSFRFS